ncbi:alpha-L-rhamnosidase [Lactiplantibacillus mudanjiangensis]|uniref:alpha-L-rhamnosidase n=1 Tax=Lactiplantibacillus mudanjiangensis TaxID=1296538 RepID=A0A660DZI4_9LACO|nr:alpha-L-rhamnosidase [Lactiplantibacillus mudanjiangensis]VDG22507.1 alfa-L-rhamnosidase [Lactobacillus curvatus] [Lactiplantibacillus mudanjiangensis]VDG26944.1 alfa-L-rhamnosidase [Lactobacillus curvatus] [Lactiplantibacillus mudanjiangensis]
MQITQILINHMEKPIGFELNDLRIEFKVKAAYFIAATKQLSIWTTDKDHPVYQTDSLAYNNNYFDVTFDLQPRTRYHVQVTVTTATETAIQTSFFETGKLNEPYTAHWIGNENLALQNTLFKKALTIAKPVAAARLYATGLGLYEAYLDQQKIGDEFLAPGVTAYDQWIQVQTYDLTDALTTGNHDLVISTGDGWYKGRYGFDGGKENIYGQQQMALAELHLTYTDGSTDVINTDQTWLTTAGKITKSAIYYGEDLDDTRQLKNWQPVNLLAQPTTDLQDRLSLPILAQDQLSVKQIIQTPAHETVLDFGQNQAGWLTFYNREPKGTKITFQMGEILQHDNFYRDNLREARAAFTYVSDGQEHWVRPHFTYFGYRYVKVTGNTLPLQTDDYQATVLYSNMSTTGQIETDNKNVNRLFQNIIWGQKSNFLDVPTDCPQRDERLGWTGDANIFSNTAAFNMNVFPFFKKYAKDMAAEQITHNGMLTMYAPAMGIDDGGAAVWGDAATTIPWNMYQTYGDPAIIKQNYPSMKAWVEWITANSKTKHLWTGTFQFGDWIALDGENPALPTGKTDEDFIASVYYYYSCQIVAKSAHLLHQPADEQHYREIATKIKQAIQAEYLTPTGRLAIDTQTAYALALYFKLVPEHQIQRVVTDLVNRLDKDNDHLKTGFVGTPFICQVLSKYGQHKLATKIFMQTDFPSWLYAVNMGATTVWERWNSVEPDGTMNKDGMNSLNHYSIGAIMEWAYKYLLGLQDHDAGYQHVTLAPHFDYRLKHLTGHFDTPYGRLAVAYQIEADANHTIKLSVKVPFGVTVDLQLPRAQGVSITVNQETVQASPVTLTAGDYTISYQPTTDYIERYSEKTSSAVIMQDPDLITAIGKIDPVLDFFKNDPAAIKGGLGTMSLTKLNTILPFINISQVHLDKINQLLAQTPLLSERQSLAKVGQ